ncbi:Growth/differentiation factor 9 [Bulinus truncatus]|nr:Growth/differentiation factor 9 [Bulinus truncatus]
MSRGVHVIQSPGFSLLGGSPIFSWDLVTPVQGVTQNIGFKKKELHKRIKSHLNKSSLKSFRFMTKVEQPEDLYLELVMKSAVLRMRIRLHKDQLQSEVKKSAKTLNVGVYLHRTLHAADEEEFVPLASGVVRVGRNFKLVEIPLNTEIFSQILDDDDSTVLLTVTFDDSNENSALAKDSAGNTQAFQKRTKAPLKVQILKPSIEITTRTRDLSSRRDKRHTETSPCEENMCCLRSINISVTDIGWDGFVKWPSFIMFNYCKGWCPRRYKPKSHSTSIQAMIHEKFPGTVPPPSCVATGYDSIAVLLHSGEWREYSDLIVNGCMCS